MSAVSTTILPSPSGANDRLHRTVNRRHVSASTVPRMRSSSTSWVLVGSARSQVRRAAREAGERLERSGSLRRRGTRWEGFALGEISMRYFLYQDAGGTGGAAGVGG